MVSGIGLQPFSPGPSSPQKKDGTPVPRRPGRSHHERDRSQRRSAEGLEGPTLLKSAVEGAERAGGTTLALIWTPDLQKGGRVAFHARGRQMARALRRPRRSARGVAQALESDVLFPGSPITSAKSRGTRPFQERLPFPSASYDELGKSTFGRHVSCGLISTMNRREESLRPSTTTSCSRIIRARWGSSRARPNSDLARERPVRRLLSDERGRFDVERGQEARRSLSHRPPEGVRDGCRLAGSRSRPHGWAGG